MAASRPSTPEPTRIGGGKIDTEFRDREGAPTLMGSGSNDLENE